MYVLSKKETVDAQHVKRIELNSKKNNNKCAANNPSRVSN